MALDREKAKQAIGTTDQNDSEFSSKLKEGHKAQVELEKIKNQHEIARIKTERGLIGYLFGSWQNVPMFIALLSVIFGGFAFYKFMGNALAVNADKVFWSESAKIALAFASAALGFIFGRGSSIE